MRLPFGERVQAFLHRHPEEFYLGGIEVLTLLIVLAVMSPVYNAFNTLYGRIFAILLLLLPCSQSAVEVMNYLTTALLFLALLGGLAAHAGGARVMTGAIRVTFWGALAMAITSRIGWLFGTVV